MKNLTALLKNSISTCFLLFLSVISYGQEYNFTKVQQDDGLIMRRVHNVGDDPGVCVLNFHSDEPPANTARFDYMYMRATPDDENNNFVITNDGTVMINTNDNCANLRDNKDAVDAIGEDIKLYINGGLAIQRKHEVGEEDPLIENGVLNFHSDPLKVSEGGLDYMCMRATANNNDNNVIITNDGTMMIGSSDDYGQLTTLKATVDGAPNDIKLYVNGGIAAATGNGTITILSDQRFKKNIVPLKNSLEVIRQSNFVEFQYNDLAGVASNKKYYGILAQEMQEVLPSTIKKGRKMIRPDAKSATEFLMFNPNDLIYSGLNAIKELDKENEDLKDRITELEAEVEKNKALEQRVNELEKILAQLIEGKEASPQNVVPPTTIGTASSYLYQNQPNPTRNSTDIEYFLSSVLSTAQIVIQDLNGSKITEFDVQGTGMGKVSFNARQFGITNGTYIYSLIANGRIIASKKMIFIE